MILIKCLVKIDQSLDKQSEKKKKQKAKSKQKKNKQKGLTTTNEKLHKNCKIVVD